MLGEWRAGTGAGRGMRRLRLGGGGEVCGGQWHVMTLRDEFGQLGLCSLECVRVDRRVGVLPDHRRHAAVRGPPGTGLRIGGVVRRDEIKTTINQWYERRRPDLV